MKNLITVLIYSFLTIVMYLGSSNGVTFQNYFDIPDLLCLVLLLLSFVFIKKNYKGNESLTFTFAILFSLAARMSRYLINEQNWAVSLDTISLVFFCGLLGQMLVSDKNENVWLFIFSWILIFFLLYNILTVAFQTNTSQNKFDINTIINSL